MENAQCSSGDPENWGLDIMLENMKWKTTENIRLNEKKI